MSDTETIHPAALQSGINAVRGWRARRLANGKAADRVEATRYAKERWPSMSAAEIKAILDGVFL